MYCHIKSGKMYQVITMDALMQVDDVWVPAVTYKSVDPKVRTVFTRARDDFDAKFIEEQLPYTGIRLHEFTKAPFNIPSVA